MKRKATKKKKKKGGEEGRIWGVCVGKNKTYVGQGESKMRIEECVREIGMKSLQQVILHVCY